MTADYGAEGDEQPPRIARDGVTDDAPAVQWYIDRGLPIPRGSSGPLMIGEPIRLRSGAVVAFENIYPHSTCRECQT